LDWKDFFMPRIEKKLIFGGYGRMDLVPHGTMGCAKKIFVGTLLNGDRSQRLGRIALHPNNR
jgi:hypothetical protein